MRQYTLQRVAKKSRKNRLLCDLRRIETVFASYNVAIKLIDGLSIVFLAVAHSRSTRVLTKPGIDRGEKSDQIQSDEFESEKQTAGKEGGESMPAALRATSCFSYLQAVFQFEFSPRANRMSHGRQSDRK